MTGKLDELLSASQQQNEMMELFRGLRNDVNRILEDRPASRVVVQDTTREEPEDKSNDEKRPPRSGQRIAASASNWRRPEQDGAVSMKPSSRKTKNTNARSKKSTRSAPRSGMIRRYHDNDSTLSEDTSDEEQFDDEAIPTKAKGPKWRDLHRLYPPTSVMTT